MTDERTREAPAERFDAPYLVFDLHEEARALRAEPTPPRHGQRQKTLYKHNERTIALFVMEADSHMAEHAAAGTVSIQAIEGEIIATADKTEHRLTQNQIITLPPHTPHSVRAAVPSVFLLQISLEPKTPPRP